MTTEASDLARLARPFPRELVQRDPGGNSYVAHENVTQWLLGIVGPFSFELVEIIRGDVPGVPPDPKGRSRVARAGLRWAATACGGSGDDAASAPPTTATA